jgi:hypothetical protein
MGSRDDKGDRALLQQGHFAATGTWRVTRANSQRPIAHVAEGEKPKCRLYSRLNWAGLLYSTRYAASLAFLPS